MDYVIKAAVAIVLFITVWLYQEENQEWVVLRNLLKDSNNIAVQAAAVNGINRDAKGDGKMVIDPITSRETFEDVLQLNLKLDDTFHPMINSRLKDPITIEYYEVVDETTAGFTGYPFLYENDTYNIVVYIHGPAVVALIKTEHPHIMKLLPKNNPIMVPAVYQYKGNEIFD